MFRMQKGETIVEVQKWFTHIVNNLLSLWKMFDKDELNIKILNCLDRSWQPKVNAISESKDLTSMATVSLFGKLREHELEMNKLSIQENKDKHVTTIVLKVVGNKSCQLSGDDSCTVPSPDVDQKSKSNTWWDPSRDPRKESQQADRSRHRPKETSPKVRHCQVRHRLSKDIAQERHRA